MANQLKILQWNANSILNKKDELIALADRLDIDLIAVSETKLKNTNRLYFTGWTILRHDRPPGRGGGVILAVRNSLALRETPLPTQNEIDAVAAEIRLNNGHRVIVASVYSPPRQSGLDTAHLQRIPNLNGSVIITGDLNARHSSWNCRTGNPAGTALRSLCLNRGLRLSHPETPTYIPRRPDFHPCTLDISVIKGMHRLSITTTTLNELSSDHLPVLTCFGLNPIRNKQQLCPVYSRADWTTFRTILTSTIDIPPDLSTSSQIDEAAEHIEKVIHHATKQSIPFIKKKIPRPDQLPTYIRDIQIQRNRARRQWQRHRDPSDRVLWNQLNRDVRLTVAEWKAENWHNITSSLTPDDRSLWQKANQLKGQRTYNGPLKSQNGFAITNTEKAETIADHFQSLMTNNQPFEIKEDEATKESQIILNTPGPELKTPAVKPSSVKKAIKNSKKKKSSWQRRHNTNHPTQPSWKSNPIPSKTLPSHLDNRFFSRALENSYGHPYPKAWQKQKSSQLLPPHQSTLHH